MNGALSPEISYSLNASAIWFDDFQDLMANRWPELGDCEMPGGEMNQIISRTLTCPPPPATVELYCREKMAAVQTSSATARAKLKRRRTKKEHIMVLVEPENEVKSVKLSEEDESKITNQNRTKSRGTSADRSENSKASDFIHVRARRGEATDSHSIAERARRLKISKRMKYLQNLVPGCEKIVGKAVMLDEIINYVQSLQQQVKFLSMKLDSLNPRLDFSADEFFPKQAFQVSIRNYVSRSTRR